MLKLKNSSFRKNTSFFKLLIRKKLRVIRRYILQFTSKLTTGIFYTAIPSKYLCKKLSHQSFRYKSLNNHSEKNNNFFNFLCGLTIEYSAINIKAVRLLTRHKSKANSKLFIFFEEEKNSFIRKFKKVFFLVDCVERNIFSILCSFI